MLGPLPLNASRQETEGFLPKTDLDKVRVVYADITGIAVERMKTYLMGATERVLALLGDYDNFTLCLLGTNAQTPEVTHTHTHP
jgi:hypothetical protein